MIAKNVFVPGCRTSNRGLTTSLGVAAVDVLLNGGLPIGSLCAFKDETGNYSQYFARCFASEGIISGNSLFAAGDCSHISFLNNLPAPTESVGPSAQNTNYSAKNTDILDDHSSIAWRYKNLPVLDVSLDQRSASHCFDRRVVLDASSVAQSDAHDYKFDFSDGICNYRNVLRFLKEKLNCDEYNLTNSTTGSPKKLLRIVLMNIGSPLWGSTSNVLHFVFSVKSLIRHKAAVVLFTYSSEILNEILKKRIKHHCDAVFRLKALNVQNSKLAGATKVNKLYERYKGLIYIEKLPLLNSLNFLIPDCLDLAFKWKREVLLIEKLHTPPELDETLSIDNKSSQLYGSAQKAVGGCSSNFTRSKLDF